MYQFYIFTKVYKKTILGKVSKGGRNFLGRICVYGRGSLQKTKHLRIDFYRRINQYGNLLKIYSKLPFSGKIGLILYANGLAAQILISANVMLNSSIFSGSLPDVKENFNNHYKGWAVPLYKMNFFTVVNCVELKPAGGFKIARAAGTSCVLIGSKKNKAILKLNSGWQISISNLCIAAIGHMSNKKHKFTILHKAGKKRLLGFRPKVRGVAKNPCDHPHGGGNGKQSKPVNPVTAWGRFIKTPTKNKQIDRWKRKSYKNL